MLKYFKNLFIKPVEEQILAAIKAGDIAATHKFILKIATDTNFTSKRILKQAIDYNNLEIVCMILYYFPYFDQTWICSTPFRYSIIKRRSAGIQRILLDYEDFSVNYKRSTLFMAIQFRSPVIMELLERGITVEPYYDFCIFHNIVVHAMEVGVNIEIVKILWDRFDYLAWKQHSSHSILCSFINNYAYLPVLMENEKKLQIVIEHYEQACFKSFVGELYINKMKRINRFEEDAIEGEVLHFLSYGAKIFTSDLDCMYHYSSDPSREFFRVLLYMDLRPSNIIKISPMYFRYTPVPDLNKFLDVACRDLTKGDNLKIISTVIQEIGRLYSFVTCNNKVVRGLPFFAINSVDNHTYYYNKIFMLSNRLPSLKQLARDAMRLAISQHYNVKNSCQLFTRIDHLLLPFSIKELLLLDVEMYPLSTFSLINDSTEALQESLLDFEM